MQIELNTCIGNIERKMGMTKYSTEMKISKGEKLMIIAIDHGNKQIKTEHFIFTSGFIEDKNRPYGQEVLRYQDNYYLLSNKRFSYTKDKSKDNRFFILTLFAIAKEIRYQEGEFIKEQNTEAVNNDKEKRKIKDIKELKNCKELVIGKNDSKINLPKQIQLAVGLPPKHFSSLYEDFQEYLKSGSDQIEFEYNNVKFCITITDVIAYPQAFAAVVMDETLLKITKVYVIDLGGYTLDYLELTYGQPDLSSCVSLEHGIITFYNQVKVEVDSRFDLLLNESDIDSIIKQENSISFERDVCEFIEKQAENFVSDIISILRERHIDLRSAKSIWMGGGAIILEQYIRQNSKVGEVSFVTDIQANAKGFQQLYKMMESEMSETDD